MATWNQDWNDLTDKPMSVIQGRKFKDLPGRDDAVSTMSKMFKATTSQDTCDPINSPRGTKVNAKDNLEKRNEMFGKNLKLFKSDAKKMVTALKLMLAATTKAAEPDLYRDLKIVITGTDAFVARMTQHAATWANSAKDSKSYDKVQDVKDFNEKKTASEARALEISLRDLKVSLNSSLKKAIAATQKIKSDPTPATYNTVIDKGGRDLYMSLVAIEKIKGDTKLGPKAKKIPSPGAHLNDIKQYGESAGQFRKLATTATANDVTNQIKLFNQLVKGIATTYASFLKEK